jgi:hypothetical protein
MPALENVRWERFAQLRSTGASYCAAYEEAGFKAGPYSKFNGSKLAHKEPVKRRIAELLEQAAEKAVIGIGWLQYQLVDVLRGKAPGKIRKTADGTVYEETDRIAAAVALMRSLGIGDGVNVKVGVGINGDAPYDPLEINDATRIAALEAFMAKVKLKQVPAAVCSAEQFPKNLISGEDLSDDDIATAQRIIYGPR